MWLDDAVFDRFGKLFDKRDPRHRKDWQGVRQSGQWSGNVYRGQPDQGSHNHIILEFLKILLLNKCDPWTWPVKVCSRSSWSNRMVEGFLPGLVTSWPRKGPMYRSHSFSGQVISRSRFSSSISGWSLSSKYCFGCATNSSLYSQLSLLDSEK